MQYKFNVDGEWRYDEHQPFVSGAYGVVNNVRIPRESDIGSVMFNSDTPGRSNMEVDENTFVRPVSFMSNALLLVYYFCSCSMLLIVIKMLALCLPFS